MSADSVIDRLDPVSDIIGITQDGKIYSGYDEHMEAAWNEIPEWRTWDNDAVDEWKRETQLSPEDRRALAEEMIRRWAAYRDAIR